MKKILRLKDIAHALSQIAPYTRIIISCCFYLCFYCKKILRVGRYCVSNTHYYKCSESLALFAEKDNAPPCP